MLASTYGKTGRDGSKSVIKGSMYMLTERDTKTHLVDSGHDVGGFQQQFQVLHGKVGYPTNTVPRSG